MPESTKVLEKTPETYPPARTPVPSLSPSGFDLAAIQSAAGNMAIQRSVEAPDQVTPPEGDRLPAPVIVDWGERFEISFGTRTTGYGDVKFLIKFRYLGAQKPERSQDQMYTIERDPALE